jgi:membrane-bound lytic murein transglycosylase B
MSERRRYPRAPAFWLALLCAVAGAALASPESVPSPGGYAARPEVQAFIAELVADEGFDADSLRELFAHARYQPRVIAAISRPVLSPPKWYEYAPKFLDPARVAAGVVFWHEHAEALSRAERERGVPQEVIIAILGVETYYGRYVGNYPVFDTLTTLAFDYPRRAEFFRGELKQFLLLAREKGLSPLAFKGSYAGAMGPAQFMPDSLRTYTAGRAELLDDPDEAVAGIADYLSGHGWQPRQPIMEPARVDNAEAEDGIRRQLDEGVAAPRALAEWVREGLTGFAIPGDLAADPVGLLMLEEPAGDSYWLVFSNWYVLTHYNRSRLYASAVHELARALKAAAQDGG